MRYSLVAAVCLLLMTPGLVAVAMQPPKPPTPPLSIDELIAKLIEHRKAKTEAAKAEATIAAELRTRLADFTEKLKELGILDPVIPPPPPTDLLAQKLREAFAADKGRREDALSLAALYRQAATLAKDASVPSSRELLRRVREASATLIGPDALPSLRNAVAIELAAALGTPSDTAFRDDQRAAAANLFAKLAAILEGL